MFEDDLFQKKQTNLNELTPTYRFPERESPLRCDSTPFRGGMKVGSNKACLSVRQLFDFFMFSIKTTFLLFSCFV